MKVYRSLADFKKLSCAIVTQGTFDGVHVAHQVILNYLKNLAQEKQGETVVITYEPHPRMVLFPEDHGLQLLSTLDEKIELLREQGIDHLLILPFTKDFSRFSSLEFIRDIIVEKIGTICLVIGYNHRFGKNREGSFEHLKLYGPAYGFEVFEIPEQDVDHVAVSSTKIRDAIKVGEVQLAAKFLSKPYSFEGRVVDGRKLGRTIGYPTANLEPVNSLKLLPADGVYAAKAEVDGKIYGGMLNIGLNPSIAGKGRSIEINIFDFNEDIYYQNIRVAFVEKLREEQNFSSIEELKTQLHCDKLQAISALAKSS